MLVSPQDILPSQDFLKPDTIKFIFDCLDNDELDKLPPMPIVRKNDAGELIAIDGHNLIAVMYALEEDIEVHVAKSARDGIEVIEDADKLSNKQLKKKFDSVLEDRKVVLARGRPTFKELLEKYPGLLDR